MDVALIVMEPEEAQSKLEAYRAGLAKRHSAAVEEEWSAAERAYRELAKGTPLIDPQIAIRDAGWRADGRPKLAIARADYTFVSWGADRMSRWWNAETRTWHGNWSPMRWRFDGMRGKRSQAGRSHGQNFEITDITEEPPCEPKRGVAMVPLVPPDVIPARGCDLSRHFVLWEVENWDAAPPRDPLLLKPIGGNLYAVIAQWDLTALERSIIAGTRQ